MILALGLAAGGCTSMEYQELGTQVLRNSQGHVIGMKEVLCECDSGEQFSRVSLFTPRVDSSGSIVGYEEAIKGGTVVLRDLDGRRIGGRYIDLRSRATNPNNKGLTIVFHSKPADRVTLASAPTMDDVLRLARLAN